MTTPEPTARPPVRWNVCPDCLGRHEDGAACLDEPPTGDLSERIDEALRTVGLARNLAAYRNAVLPVVEEALADLAAELRAVEIDRDQWRNRARALRAALDADQPKETR